MLEPSQFSCLGPGNKILKGKCIDWSVYRFLDIPFRPLFPEGKTYRFTLVLWIISFIFLFVEFYSNMKCL